MALLSPIGEGEPGVVWSNESPASFPFLARLQLLFSHQVPVPVNDKVTITHPDEKPKSAVEWQSDQLMRCIWVNC